MSAPPLAAERERRVERRGRVGCEQGRELALPAVELLGEPARPDEQPDLGAVGAQRDQHDRADARAAELGDGRPRSCRAARRRRTGSIRSRSACERLGTTAARARPGALHSVDSTSWPFSSSSSSWLVSIGSTRAERSHGDLGYRERLAERAHVDEQPRERREIDRTRARASPPPARASACEQRPDRVVGCPPGSAASRLDVDHADDARSRSAAGSRARRRRRA